MDANFAHNYAINIWYVLRDRSLRRTIQSGSCILAGGYSSPINDQLEFRRWTWPITSKHETKTKTIVYFENCFLFIFFPTLIHITQSNDWMIDWWFLSETGQSDNWYTTTQQFRCTGYWISVQKRANQFDNMVYPFPILFLTFIACEKWSVIVSGSQSNSSDKRVMSRTITHDAYNHKSNMESLSNLSIYLILLSIIINHQSSSLIPLIG